MTFQTDTDIKSTPPSQKSYLLVRLPNYKILVSRSKLHATAYGGTWQTEGPFPQDNTLSPSANKRPLTAPLLSQDTEAQTAAEVPNTTALQGKAAWASWLFSVQQSMKRAPTATHLRTRLPPRYSGTTSLSWNRLTWRPISRWNTFPVAPRTHPRLAASSTPHLLLLPCSTSSHHSHRLPGQGPRNPPPHTLSPACGSRHKLSLDGICSSLLP